MATGGWTSCDAIGEDMSCSGRRSPYLYVCTRYEVLSPVRLTLTALGKVNASPGL
jgi:hypothetical protein